MILWYREVHSHPLAGGCTPGPLPGRLVEGQRSVGSARVFFYCSDRLPSSSDPHHEEIDRFEDHDPLQYRKFSDSRFRRGRSQAQQSRRDQFQTKNENKKFFSSVKIFLIVLLWWGTDVKIKDFLKLFTARISAMTIDRGL